MLLKAINGLGTIEYLDQCQTHGRGKLPDPVRVSAQAIYAAASDQLAHPTALGRAERSLAAFLCDALGGEDALRRNPMPRYVAYTNMPALDRFLLTGEQAPAQASWSRAKRALALFIRDWATFEHARLSKYESGELDSRILGYEDRNATKHVGHLQERERTLLDLTDFTVVADMPSTSIVKSEIGRYGSD